MADDPDPDRLSQLPDELLQHILHLAPCREAETTAVLSRRWRGLWPPATGAVKIDIPSRDNWCDAPSLRSAKEALAAGAAHGPVERLAINVGRNNDADVVGDVLSHPASRGVQDVRISADTAGSDRGDDSLSSMPHCGFLGFEVSFGSLPSAALRVLHITNCSDLTPPRPASTFLCLEVLRLRRCVVSLRMLRDMVVASPQLSTLQLEFVCLYNSSNDCSERWDSAQSICCPGVTTLVLLNCRHSDQRITIQLDLPRLQHFRYRGTINQFTLRSPLPDLMRAYLHILACYRSDSDEKCEGFWNFLKNVSDAKVLKLKLEWPIDYVAAVERKEIRELLLGENQSAQPIMFCVEHLEIDAPHNPESKDVGVAIGNLLQCCPALHDLKLKLNTASQRSSRRNWSTSPQSKTQLEFQKSIDHFRRRRDDPLVPLCVDDGKFEISDIPGLSDRFHFGCLQFHLKRLSLQFHMDKDNPSNCVGVRLVKFFVERAMALEEMYIDDGNMKLWEHMNCKISRYSGNPQHFPEYHVLAMMSQALRMNQFSSSKISGWFQQHKIEVRRTNPWSASRCFTILPLEVHK